MSCVREENKSKSHDFFISEEKADIENEQTSLQQVNFCKRT